MTSQEIKVKTLSKDVKVAKSVQWQRVYNNSFPNSYNSYCRKLPTSSTWLWLSYIWFLDIFLQTFSSGCQIASHKFHLKLIHCSCTFIMQSSLSYELSLQTTLLLPHINCAHTLLCSAFSFQSSACLQPLTFSINHATTFPFVWPVIWQSLCRQSLHKSDLTYTREFQSSNVLES